MLYHFFIINIISPIHDISSFFFFFFAYNDFFFFFFLFFFFLLFAFLGKWRNKFAIKFGAINFVTKLRHWVISPCMSKWLSDIKIDVIKTYIRWVYRKNLIPKVWKLLLPYQVDRKHTKICWNLQSPQSPSNNEDFARDWITLNSKWCHLIQSNTSITSFQCDIT